MSAQRHNVHRCVCMCPGDPCVWSAVVHTQENIFISTCTRGVQAWVDHSDRIIQVSAGQCIQHRSAICVFTALTCTDLQISSKRLLFLNFGLEQIQNSKKSGRKKNWLLTSAGVTLIPGCCHVILDVTNPYSFGIPQPQTDHHHHHRYRHYPLLDEAKV